MNLTMQTRRAVITLGLVAAAMLCVAARSAATADLHASAPARSAVMKSDARPGSVTVRVHSGVVMTVATDRKSRKLVRVAAPNSNG